MNKKIHHIVVLGDSITFGFSDRSGKGGWVGRLKVWFEKQYPSDYNALFNLGISGATSAHLSERAPVELKHRKPDLVLIDIGANDAAHFVNKHAAHHVSPEKFGSNLRSIITAAKKYTKKIILLTPIPCDEQKTNPVSWAVVYYNNTDLQRYSLLIRKIAKETSVKVFDIFSLWQNTNYKKLLPDGVHPNTKGHELLYRQIKSFLEKN